MWMYVLSNEHQTGVKCPTIWISNGGLHEVLSKAVCAKSALTFKIQREAPKMVLRKCRFSKIIRVSNLNKISFFLHQDFSKN